MTCADHYLLSPQQTLFLFQVLEYDAGYPQPVPSLSAEWCNGQHINFSFADDQSSIPMGDRSIVRCNVGQKTMVSGASVQWVGVMLQ